MFDFSEQNIVVTGGTRGIGSAITKSFLESKGTVIATYAGNVEAANEFKKNLGELGKNLHLFKFDVSNFKECEGFAKKIIEDFKKIDVLVNNAGIRKDALLATMSEEAWDSVIDINLKGTFNMARAFIMPMIGQRYGRIVNVSSIAGKIGLPGQTNYSASKAGQHAFSQSLSKEVAKRNITVNCVAPGFIETELIGDLPADQVKMYKDQVPMKRFGKPEEVADTIKFLASKQASYITGAMIDVSGGL